MGEILKGNKKLPQKKINGWAQVSNAFITSISITIKLNL